MKTPREVLFRRHDTADAKLDALRREVVAQLPSTPAARRAPFPFHLALTVWRELILPARRIWAGLAAAWVLLLVANTQISDAPRAAAAAQNNAPVELWQKYQEEKQLLAELSGTVEAQVAPPPVPFAPRPRSERLPRWKVV
jgi:hypothetical protein